MQNNKLKPGWKILEEAALAVKTDSTGEAVNFFQIQLLARKGEYIPSQQNERLTPILIEACCLIFAREQYWPPKIAEFFECLFDKATMDELLAAHPNWIVRDQGQCPVGYVVFNKDYRPPIGEMDLKAARAVAIPGSRVQRGPAGLLVVTRP